MLLGKSGIVLFLGLLKDTEMSQISKVQILDRKLISDERGWFFKPITGYEDGLPPYTGEIYLTMGLPGQSKGGHYHPEAVEWFTVIKGLALLQLEDIETHERVDIEMSLDKSITVYIPNKVAHVVKNIGSEDFILLAYTDKLYDPNDTISYVIR